MNQLQEPMVYSEREEPKLSWAVTSDGNSSFFPSLGSFGSALLQELALTLGKWLFITLIVIFYPKGLRN